MARPNMRDYVFMFGYECPLAWEANEKTGSDYENCGFFKIRAATQDEALRWGETLADWYVMRLFDDQQPGRWSKARFAFWIEERPDAPKYEWAIRTQSISPGEHPDFAEIRQRFRD